MRFAALWAVLLGGCCCARPACRPPEAARPSVEAPRPVATPCADLPQTVPFILGERDLRPGDDVTILGVRGDRARLEVGGRYCVWGRFVLRSKPTASLCLWSTDGETEATEAQRCATVTGRGDFAFRFRVRGPLGQLHVSFYPVEGGEGFGGVYFDNRGPE
jgi:hypothetical protein